MNKKPQLYRNRKLPDRPVLTSCVSASTFKAVHTLAKRLNVSPSKLVAGAIELFLGRKCAVPVFVRWLSQKQKENG